MNSPRSYEQLARERVVHMRAQRARHTERRVSPRQAYEQLRSAIGLHGWDGGAGKLAESDLVEELGVSRNSVRAALQLLAAEGLITRKTRTGTQVANQLLQIPIDEEYPRPVVGSTHQPWLETTDHHFAVIPAPPGLTDICGAVDEAIVMERLLAVGRAVVGRRLTVVPVDDDIGPVDDHLALRLRVDAQRLPFPAAFRIVYGLDQGDGRATVQSRPCPPELVDPLGVEAGSPLLFRELVLTDVDGVTRQVSYTHFRGDRVAIATDF